MSRTKKTSAGQALVLVTLALFAMAGMMGLAVDLGWSFFVQKEAQAAADGAALAAVQEAVGRIRAGAAVSVSAFDCSSSGTGAAQVDCEAPISCGAVASTSNLNNGCQYALKNGFDWTSSRQSVTMQANAAPANFPPTPAGITSPVNISYWVTVKTVQTIPQLFSAVLGNSQGTVSAIATAAIAGSVVPGSFFGMNRAGDCWTDASGNQFNCGLDISSGTGTGGMTCAGAPGGKADICAPAGIILSSSCNAVGTGCSQAYAGASNGPGAYGSSLVVMSSGAVTGTWTPSTPTYTTNPSTFQDPTASNSQPPLTTSGTSIGTCGIPHSGGSTSPAVISGGKNGTTIGPFLYYTYSATNGSTPIPDGAPIQITGNVTFSATAECPTVNAQIANGTTAGTVQTGSHSNQVDSNFPTYMFYGGLQNQGTVNLGPGQYVMAGTSGGSCNGGAATVFCGAGTIQPDPNQPAATNTGTMFIDTDSNYPGMNLPTSFPALNQGTIDLKNSNITMYGLSPSANATSALPGAQDLYGGIVWWQDRRNSTVGYNEASNSPGCPDCTGDDGSVIYCDIGCPDSPGYTPGNLPPKLATLLAANHVTNTSPGITMDPGNGNISLRGVFYQPRGAWMELVHGTTGFSCGKSIPNCPLQVVTGSLVEDTGDTGLLLQGPTNPLLTFKPTLIQ